MVVLSMNGSRFLGCSRFPECKNTKSISTGVSCPQDGCKGSLVERKPAEARSFWMQSIGLHIATWDRPVAQKCGKYDFPC